MDLNFGHATLVRHFATAYMHDIQSQLEVATPAPEERKPRTSLVTVMRQWIGTRLVAWGTHHGQATEPRPADTGVAS